MNTTTREKLMNADKNWEKRKQYTIRGERIITMQEIYSTGMDSDEIEDSYMQERAENGN